MEKLRVDTITMFEGVVDRKEKDYFLIKATWGRRPLVFVHKGECRWIDFEDVAEGDGVRFRIVPSLKRPGWLCGICLRWSFKTKRQKNAAIKKQVQEQATAL